RRPDGDPLRDPSGRRPRQPGAYAGGARARLARAAGSGLNAMTAFLALFVGLLAAGMPVFLVLGLGAGARYAASGQPPGGAAQLVINELNSPNLMALPLFVMAAAFMRFGGIANALVKLAAAWLGGLPGSLGLVTVVACTLFAAICGSSVA